MCVCVCCLVIALRCVDVKQTGSQRELELELCPVDHHVGPVGDTLLNLSFTEELAIQATSMNHKSKVFRLKWFFSFKRSI